MSAVSLPSYVDHTNPLNRTPSYSLEPHDYERRIALADRLHPRPSGNFVKESKGGNVRLRLTAQEDNVELPVYGLRDHVSGTVELSKTEGITSVEVKVLRIAFSQIPFLNIPLSPRLKADFGSRRSQRGARQLPLLF
jgi:hypothetical protein